MDNKNALESPYLLALKAPEISYLYALYLFIIGYNMAYSSIIFYCSFSYISNYFLNYSLKISLILLWLLLTIS